MIYPVTMIHITNTTTKKGGIPVEKRLYERYNMSFLVRMTGTNPNNKKNYFETNYNTAVNISANGILLNSEKDTEIGKEVRLTFLKPNSFKLFNTVGKIVRKHNKTNNTFDLGIHFISLTKKEQENLQYHLKKD